MTNIYRTRDNEPFYVELDPRDRRYCVIDSRTNIVTDWSSDQDEALQRASDLNLQLATASVMHPIWCRGERCVESITSGDTWHRGDVTTTTFASNGTFSAVEASARITQYTVQGEEPREAHIELVLRDLEMATEIVLGMTAANLRSFASWLSDQADELDRIEDAP